MPKLPESQGQKRFGHWNGWDSLRFDSVAVTLF
jgi:hypothetical protein